MNMSAPAVTNVLLRCTRTERPSLPFFEKARKDLAIWVWELGPKIKGHDWEECCLSIHHQIEPHLAALRSLSEQSEDYTLFIAVDAHGVAPMILIPPSLSALAAEAGYGIQISFEES